jgi:hypothetical protein
MEILLLVILVCILLALAVRAWKSHEIELRRPSALRRSPCPSIRSPSRTSVRAIHPISNQPTMATLAAQTPTTVHATAADMADSMRDMSAVMAEDTTNKHTQQPSRNTPAPNA